MYFCFMPLVSDDILLTSNLSLALCSLRAVFRTFYSIFYSVMYSGYTVQNS